MECARPPSPQRTRVSRAPCLATPDFRPPLSVASWCNCRPWAGENGRYGLKKRRESRDGWILNKDDILDQLRSFRVSWMQHINAKGTCRPSPKQGRSRYPTGAISKQLNDGMALEYVHPLAPSLTNHYASNLGSADGNPPPTSKTRGANGQSRRTGRYHPTQGLLPNAEDSLRVVSPLHLSHAATASSSPHFLTRAISLGQQSITQTLLCQQANHLDASWRPRGAGLPEQRITSHRSSFASSSRSLAHGRCLASHLAPWPPPWPDYSPCIAMAQNQSPWFTHHHCRPPSRAPCIAQTTNHPAMTAVLSRFPLSM